MLGKLGLNRVGLGPEIWGKVLVGLAEGHEGSLDEVLSSSGMSDGLGVAIINTSELEELLGNWGSDDTGSTWGWDKLDTDGSALSSDLSWNGMDSSESVSPETSSDWDELELGSNDGSLDGNLDFLGNLDSESDVTVLISNGNNSLEAGSLSGLGLLLDGDDLHDLVREGDLLVALLNELLDNLGFLDWDGEGVDLLEGLDEVTLHESSELGLWHPLLFASTSTWTSTATSAATSAEASSASAFSTFSFWFRC